MAHSGSNSVPSFYRSIYLPRETTVELWVNATEENPDEEVRTLRELACENEAEPAFWDLREEEDEEVAERALREFDWERLAEEAYNEVKYEEQARQEVREEALYEDDYYDSLEEQARQVMRKEALYQNA